MKLKILSGNIRGINSPEERCLLELHFRTWKADFLFLQQTKLQHFPQQFISHLGSGRIVAFAALETEGTWGGRGGYCDYLGQGMAFSILFGVQQTGKMEILCGLSYLLSRGSV